MRPSPMSVLLILSLPILPLACSDDQESPGLHDTDAGVSDVDSDGQADGFMDVPWDTPVDDGEESTVETTVILSGTLRLEGSIEPTDRGGYVLLLLPSDYELDLDDLAVNALAGTSFRTGAGYVGGQISIPGSVGSLKRVTYDERSRELRITATPYQGVAGAYTLMVLFCPAFTTTGMDDDPTYWTGEPLSLEIESIPATVHLGPVTLVEILPDRSITVTGSLSLSDTVYTYRGSAYAVWLMPEQYEPSALGTTPPEGALALVWLENPRYYSGEERSFRASFREYDPDTGQVLQQPWGQAELTPYTMVFQFINYYYRQTGPTHQVILEDVSIAALPARLDLDPLLLTPVSW